MWKRDEAVRPAGSQPAPQLRRRRGRPSPHAETSHHMEKDIVNIGKSVVIKGELNGSEDLTIEGHVEGTIQLRDHVLTIGPNGRIKAQVFAKSVIVLGEVTGNVTASDKVDIRDNGSVDGDIVSPRVAIAEGAHFRGSVDMQRKAARAAGRRPRADGQAGTRARSAPQPGAGSQADRPARRGVDHPGSWAFSTAICRAKDSSSEPPPLRRGGGRPRPLFATKALPKFLASLTARESPVLLDLGPVVGSNVSFFGEQLGCKIFVEDIYADLERHVRERDADELPAFLAKRFPQADGSVDGILCWDLLDYLDARRRRRWPSS